MKTTSYNYKKRIYIKTKKKETSSIFLNLQLDHYLIEVKLDQYLNIDEYEQLPVSTEKTKL